MLLTIIIIVSGSSLLFAAAWFVFKTGFEQSVFFKVDEVEIDGNDYVSSKKILALTGLNVKSSMWKIKTAELAEKLERQERIKKAEIDKDWPDRIRIIIQERSPEALVSRKGELFYLDDEGVIFSPVLPADDVDFPVITFDESIYKKDALKKKYTYMALEFLGLASQGNPELPKQNISEIHFGNSGLIMFLVDYPLPVYLGQKDMAQKYRRLSRVLSWLYSRQRIGETEYIDMNYVTGDEEERQQRGKDVMVVFKES